MLVFCANKLSKIKINFRPNVWQSVCRINVKVSKLVYHVSSGPKNKTDDDDDYDHVDDAADDDVVDDDDDDDDDDHD